MKAKMMESAKKHYEQLMSVLDQMGMSMEAFVDTIEDESEMIPEMMGKEDEEEGEDEEDKIAMLMAKMSDEEEEA